MCVDIFIKYLIRLRLRDEPKECLRRRLVSPLIRCEAGREKTKLFVLLGLKWPPCDKGLYHVLIWEY